MLLGKIDEKNYYRYFLIFDLILFLLTSSSELQMELELIIGALVFLYLN